MHELTASEAATLLSILSKESGAEISNADPLGIPTSTFYATRRKAYDSGWLSDRYVPHPWALGIWAIDCILIKPNPADRARVESELSTSNEIVLLWSGPNVVFGIRFRQTREPVEVENGTTVSVTADAGSIPVFFDYSLPWSRFIRVERETGYPRPLGAVLLPARRRIPSTLTGLVLQDQDGGQRTTSANRWHSSAKLTRSEQRQLDRGVVGSRTFLNLDVLPPYDGRELGEIVLLTGELREGISSTDLLRELNSQCHVSPFFLADDGTTVLLLALGQVGAGESRRTRVSRASGPVAATLDVALKKLQMIIEHTERVRKLIDHRYDRLLPPPRIAAAGPHSGASE